MTRFVADIESADICKRVNAMSDNNNISSLNRLFWHDKGYGILAVVRNVMCGEAE